MSLRTSAKVGLGVTVGKAGCSDPPRGLGHPGRKGCAGPSRVGPLLRGLLSEADKDLLGCGARSSEHEQKPPSGWAGAGKLQTPSGPATAQREPLGSLSTTRCSEVRSGVCEGSVIRSV